MLYRWFYTWFVLLSMRMKFLSVTRAIHTESQKELLFRDLTAKFVEDWAKF